MDSILSTFKELNGSFSVQFSTYKSIKKLHNEPERLLVLDLLSWRHLLDADLVLDLLAPFVGARLLQHNRVVCVLAAGHQSNGLLLVGAQLVRVSQLPLSKLEDEQLLRPVHHLEGDDGRVLGAGHPGNRDRDGLERRDLTILELNQDFVAAEVQPTGF
jgi:hypothetical protein